MDKMKTASAYCDDVLGTKDGVRFANTKEDALPNAQEAEDYICEENDKWDDATAVWYWHGGKLRIMIGGWCPS